MADLTDYATDVSLGRGRMRLEFENEGRLEKRVGCEGTEETALIDAIMILETDGADPIAQTDTFTFMYDGYFELEYLGLGGEGEVAPAFWSLLGEQPGESVGYLNANCMFSPVTECGAGAFLGAYDDATGIAIVGQFALE